MEQCRLPYTRPLASQRFPNFILLRPPAELPVGPKVRAPVGPLKREDRAYTTSGIQRELTRDGFVSRYAPDEQVEGVPGEEGAFLPCSFWLADNLALQGHQQEARLLFERLLAVRNDLGLLSEEYDPVARRLLGNFPQAFSHIGLINTAFNLTHGQAGPAQDRPER